ncbi:MAG TPA: radical SAM protein, partial [Bryobacteraceae bacterium]|nr:radical SAM protein [Bryobacteraceae bacterium]
SSSSSRQPEAKSAPMTLPDPVFPQFPELLGRDNFAPHNFNEQRRWSPSQIYRQMRGWMFPWMKSRVLPGFFQPIIAYLFVEWKCNLDCHYCWAFNNRVPGMTEDTARRAIDWLHDTPCRVLALQGGEPLLRPQFAHKVVYYASKKGFWPYVSTNARLLRHDVIDRLADAGMATFNFAVDVVDEKPGLPKALAPVRKYLEYLVKKQYSYGYTVFLNINITRRNMDDVVRLTEIAREHALATDYHVNEPPMLEQPHFKHRDENDTFLRQEDLPKFDELIDWLVEKKREGYKMVNSAARIREMKDFARGKLQEWNCRAGQNTLIIRTDGSLAPCFPMYSAGYDWGVVEDPRFDPQQLSEMKQSCQPHCFSTLNHIVGYCYNDARVIRWLMKQAARGFQGVTNFE